MSLNDNEYKKGIALYEQQSAERKQLQKDGLLPDWYTTAGWQMFKAKYAVPSEQIGIKQRFETIAKTLAKHLPESLQTLYEEKFFDYMWKGYIIPSSPVLANCGTDRGMVVSCSGQVVEDSIDGFYSALRESALLSKQAFGTSGDFSSIRPRNSPFHGGGKANGVREVIDDFFTMASKVSQGQSRRGSFAAYLDIEHDDFYECLDSLKIDPNGKNYGWTIKDSFVAKLKAGDKEALQRFKDALYVKLLTGKGYLFFVDKANRKRPQMYKDLGLEIVATNLCCIAGDQRVVTEQGLVTVKELYEQGNPNVVLGLTGTSNASKMLLPRPNAPMVEIQTSEGYTHKVTPDHRVWKKDFGWTEAQHLLEGDKILIQQMEGMFGEQHEPIISMLMGLVAGDGTFADNSVCIDIWGDKTLQYAQEIEEHIAQVLVNQHTNTVSTLQPKFTYSNQQAKARLCSAPLTRLLASYGFTKETKLKVPELVWKGSKRTVENYLRGLYLTDGNIQSCKETCTLVVSSISKEFLQEIQILWANLGVKTSISLMREGGVTDFGEERGGVYETKPCYRLLITSIQGCKIAEKALRLSEFRNGTTVDNYKERISKKGYKQKMYATFTGLKQLPNEDAYCLTVDSDTHAWTVNGLITHNTEIMLHSSPEYTYSCILTSINLKHWDIIKDSDIVYTAMLFLDCITSEFIQQSEGIVGLEKVRNFTIKGRAVGMGVMGFQTYLHSKHIAYEELQAMFINEEIFKHIHDESLRASKDLAVWLGEPEWCKGYGVRNTHRTCLPPTKSSSTLAGSVSESVFPEPAMVYEVVSSAGELPRISSEFYHLMKERGQYNKETLNSIINNVGSVQHLDWLSQEEKNVFRTAFEMDQEVLYRYAKLRQKYICQGQSLNFYVPDNGSEQKVSDLLTRCVLDEDILSVYYIYSRSGVVVSDQCLSCAA